jgi:hypothetical protein
MVRTPPDRFSSPLTSWAGRLWSNEICSAQARLLTCTSTSFAVDGCPATDFLDPFRLVAKRGENLLQRRPVRRCWYREAEEVRS